MAKTMKLFRFQRVFLFRNAPFFSPFQQKRTLVHVEDSGSKDKDKKVLSELPNERIESEKKAKEESVEKQEIPKVHFEDAHYSEAQKERKATPPTGPQNNPY